LNDYVGGQSFCCGEKELVSNNQTGDNTFETPDYEHLIFFYHPDHLGSTALVTDNDGNVVQSVAYIPYGEVFIEERNGTWNTPYLFNGKELDEETGLYYYGARYLNPTNGMWLSTDPLFEKYVGMSPYNYCVGNPVKLVDVDGRDVALMIAPEGAGGNGHMAAIIQKSDGTCYYMTAGAAENAGLAKMSTSGCKGAVMLKPVPKECKRDEKGNVMVDYDGWPIAETYCTDVKEAYDYVRTMDKNNSEYTDYIIIKTTKEQDKKIFRNAKSTRNELNKNKSNYHPLFNNCAEIVISCVEDDGTGIDIKDGFTPVPNRKFDNIKNSFDIEK
jgi:RHS repeat-associated protein